MSHLQEHWDKLQEKDETLGLLEFIEGGEGSGNFGHAGRPGEVGGSASSLKGRRGVGGKIRVKPPTPSKLDILHRVTSGFMLSNPYHPESVHWDSVASLVAANRMAGKPDESGMPKGSVEKAIAQTTVGTIRVPYTQDELNGLPDYAKQNPNFDGMKTVGADNTPENRQAAWERALAEKMSNIQEVQTLAAYKYDTRFPHGGMTWRGVTPEEGEALVNAFNSGKTIVSTRALIASSIKPAVAYGSKYVLQFEDLSGDRVLGAKWMREFTPAYGRFASEHETTLFGSTKWRMTGITSGISTEAKATGYGAYDPPGYRTTIHIRPYYGNEPDIYYKDEAPG